MKFCLLSTGPLLENQISQTVTPGLIHTQTQLSCLIYSKKIGYSWDGLLLVPTQGQL